MAPDPHVHCWYIVRQYKSDKPNVVRWHHQTEGDTIMWRNNPESASRTATSPEARAHTEKHGEWMDWAARYNPHEGAEFMRHNTDGGEA